MPRKFKISGTGCCLVDQLFSGIDFNSELVRPYLSVTRGDGGLTPGKLVFEEEFQKFCKGSFEEAIGKITSGRKHDKINIGGPAIVSLINAAQLLGSDKCDVVFYGRGGNDDQGKYLHDAIAQTPVKTDGYKLLDYRTPSTIVLSDPHFDNGHGERMFINSIGAAWHFSPEDIDEDFFRSDIVVFGGTALTPGIHDNLSSLLKKAKKNGCITVVNTVFDFRNEKQNPAGRWPMGESDDSYKYIDVLISDLEEACRLSGCSGKDSALAFFRGKGLSSVIITDGAKNVLAWSDGKFFSGEGVTDLPVSEKIKTELQKPHTGDTTGCGDNFAGGVIASIAMQVQNRSGRFDLTEACRWGIVSGGFTCFYLGGTYFEKEEGEKMSLLRPYYDSYCRQLTDK